MMVVARFTMFLVQLSLKYNYELLGPSGDWVSVGLRFEIGFGLDLQEVNGSSLYSQSPL